MGVGLWMLSTTALLVVEYALDWSAPDWLWGVSASIALAAMLLSAELGGR